MKGYLEHEMLTLFFLHFALIGWICCSKNFKSKKKECFIGGSNYIAGSAQKQNNKQKAVNSNS